MKRNLLCLFGCLLLTACMVVPPMDEQTVVPSVNGSGADLTAMRKQTLESLVPKALTGSLNDRFLETGFWEIGQEHAPHTLTIFTLPACEYCRTLHNDLLPQLEEEFVDAGTLKIQVAPVALQKYATSRHDAKLLLCAGEVNRARNIWQLLMSGQPLVSKPLETCATAPESELRLVRLESLAKNLEIDLYPTLILDGEVMTGLPEWWELEGWIKSKINT